MAEVRHYTVTVPAGTAASAPLHTPLELYDRAVTAMVVRFPPGCAGLVGAALVREGLQVAPDNIGGWFIGDDQASSWSASRPAPASVWELRTYNEGALDHQVFATLTVERTVRQRRGGSPR